MEMLARFKGSKLDRLEAKHPWIDRTSLLMNGDHVTLGEADAEVELDVRFENKSAAKSGTGCVHTRRRLHCEPVMPVTTQNGDRGHDRNGARRTTS